MKHSLKVLREKRRDFRVKKRKKEAPNTKMAKFTADKKPREEDEEEANKPIDWPGTKSLEMALVSSFLSWMLS